MLYLRLSLDPSQGVTQSLLTQKSLPEHSYAPSSWPRRLSTALLMNNQIHLSGNRGDSISTWEATMTPSVIPFLRMLASNFTHQSARVVGASGWVEKVSREEDRAGNSMWTSTEVKGQYSKKPALSTSWAPKKERRQGAIVLPLTEGWTLDPGAFSEQKTCLCRGRCVAQVPPA